ncbi:tRNA 2-thiocytidine(32) synthetase TtcA [Cytophaga aurantiaca]|uniref:tRNA 2-thiocytidine(32) synthetase TtcA n=1 Tax=Cytophaga aurantiaca TaxID=29530 RepID=UPI000370460B|nr:tRNA 2-thiocytidine(32) synthetase TtcA [Cytophaga aurantiaca]
MPLPSPEEKNTNRLRKCFWEAIDEFTLIEPGDKIMVCLSGGKDSYTMLDLFLHVQSVRKNFEIIAVNLDQKQPDYPEHILPEYLTKLGVNFKIVEKDTYSIVIDKTPVGKTMCSLCSRLRRGNLYATAEEIGATKIALGHHREDVLETFFLNLFFSGKMEAMPAKYRTDDGKHVVIRPMVYCKENEIAAYAVQKNFPIIPCNLCGSQENMQRKLTKKMLSDWEVQYPDRKEVIYNALKNISPSHLFDTDLYDFKNLEHRVDELNQKDSPKAEEYIP